MILTDGERQKFAEYCRATAHSSRALVEQMGILPAPVAQALEEKHVREADALDIVARMLEHTEGATLEGKG